MPISSQILLTSGSPSFGIFHPDFCANIFSFSFCSGVNFVLNRFLGVTDPSSTWLAITCWTGALTGGWQQKRLVHGWIITRRWKLRWQLQTQQISDSIVPSGPPAKNSPHPSVVCPPVAVAWFFKHSMYLTVLECLYGALWSACPLMPLTTGCCCCWLARTGTWVETVLLMAILCFAEFYEWEEDGLKENTTLIYDIKSAQGRESKRGRDRFIRMVRLEVRLLFCWGKEIRKGKERNKINIKWGWHGMAWLTFVCICFMSSH